MDGGTKLPVSKGLRDIIVTAAFQALLPISCPGERCSSQYGNILGLWILSYPGSCLESVQLGQEHIHNDQVRKLCRSFLDSLQTVLRDRDLVAQDL